MIQKQQIILKHRDGLSNRKIAEQLGIDKNTVNTYVKAYDSEIQKLLSENPDADPAELSPSILEKPRYNTENRGLKDSTKEALPLIQTCLKENEKKRLNHMQKQQMRKIDIYDYLKKNGCHVSYSTVKRLISILEPPVHEAYIRQDHLPGEEVEFDWGTVRLNIGGTGYLKYQMAVFTSAYGNYRFSRLYRTQDTAAFQESHADFFSFCGGVYKTVVYDNMKVAVKQFVGLSEKEPTEALLQISAYYRFHYRFCNARRGNEKGHVERSVDVIRHAAFTDPGDDTFDTLSQANDHLLQCCMEKNREALSDSRIPEETFTLEKPHLLAAGPKMNCFMRVKGLRVDKYSTVLANKVHYSVPDQYVQKTVDARIYTNRVEIYSGSEKIAQHERHYKQGEYVLDIFHYLRTLKRKPGALPMSSALRQSDEAIRELYESYYKSRPKEFLAVLELVEEIGVRSVKDSVNVLKRKSPSDLSADKLRTVHENLSSESTERSQYGTDRLSRKSKEMLSQYDQLRNLMNGRTVV